MTTTLVSLLIAAIGVIAAFIAGQRQGGKVASAKTDRDRLDDISEAKAIEDAIAGRTDAENRKELGKWSRR